MFVENGTIDIAKYNFDIHIDFSFPGSAWGIKSGLCFHPSPSAGHYDFRVARTLMRDVDAGTARQGLVPLRPGHWRALIPI